MISASPNSARGLGRESCRAPAFSVEVLQCGMPNTFAAKQPRPTGQECSLDTRTPSLTANKLLAALPPADFKSLSDHFAIISLAQQTVLFDLDDEVDHVFFPLSGMVSLLVVLKNGDAIET